MKTRKNPPIKFTKQKMIDDINALRKTTMRCQIITSDICKLYPSLYNYKIVNNLIQLGLLRLAQKKGKSSYYKWNFDSKVDLETFDALFRNVIAHKKNVKQKYAQNKIIRIKKQELIKSQQKANLQTEEPIFEPIKEVVMKEIEMPEGFEIWSLNAQARYLDLVPTEEEVQGWKKEIEYLKDELKNKIESLNRQQTANKSYKKRIFETEENLNQSLKIIKIQENKIQGYENSLNSEKVSAESYKKRFEDAQKSLDEAKKVINEQEIAIEFFKQKKPFKSIKPKIEPKQVKYFKLFGYTIYEKN